MNKLEFSNDLIEKANSIGVEISQKQAEQFYTYMELLLEWNEKINLTAITEENEVILENRDDGYIIEGRYYNDFLAAQRICLSAQTVLCLSRKSLEKNYSKADKYEECL